MEDIRMSEKERRRLVVMGRVEAGGLTLRQAAERLGISYGHEKRVRKRQREEGDVGFVHRSRGRASNRGYGKQVKEDVLRLYRERCADFWPTLFAEKLSACHDREVGHDMGMYFNCSRGGNRMTPYSPPLFSIFF